MTTIALLPGDGIGVEILDGPITLLRQPAAEGLPLTLTDPMPYGTTGWMETGSVLPPVTVEACRNSDVILSGAVGTHPGVSAEQCPHPEKALTDLRHLFDLRISIRTVWAPGRDEMAIVCNIVGGAYVSGDHRRESDGVTEAVDEIRLSPERICEVLAIASDLASGVPGRRYVSVDKPSVFATSRLWRRVATQVAAERGLPFDHLYVDRAAYELARGGRFPGVLATEGIFGDILTDIASASAGSPALCGSATVNPDRAAGHGATGLFEPAHGSSPHRTGTRRSNPTGAWLGLAALFDWCPDLHPYGMGPQVRAALEEVYAAGVRTYDLAISGIVRPADLDQFNSAVLSVLKRQRS